jgi:hypothetical protein
MNNQHNFDSIITQKHEIDSIIENKHSFVSSLINNHGFESIVNGFRSSLIFDIPLSIWFAYWSEKFTTNTNITVTTIKTKTRIFSEFSSNVGMTVNRLLVSTAIKPIAEFITFTAVSAIMKILQGMGLATFFSLSVFEVRMRDFLKVNLANTSLTTTGFDIVITAKDYYLVSEWDSSLLSAMDGKLLNEVDYIIV